jgi:hypothetical protein
MEDMPLTSKRRALILFYHFRRQGTTTVAHEDLANFSFLQPRKLVRPMAVVALRPLEIVALSAPAQDLETGSTVYRRKASNSCLYLF